MGLSGGQRTGIGDELTERQLKVIQEIVAFKVQFTYFPTIRELAARMGVALGTIQHHLHVLKRKGVIDWVKGRPRAFKLKTVTPCRHCSGSGFQIAEGQ